MGCFGNLKEYMDTFRETPKSIGGCIWEYVDHAIWTKPSVKPQNNKDQKTAVAKCCGGPIFSIDSYI